MVRSSVVAACVLCSTVRAAALFAQSPSPLRAWEIGVHAGGSRSSDATAGTGALPPAGATIPATLGSPTPGRFVSSWMFGDGALQLNQALTSARLTERLTPLDNMLLGPIAEQPSGGTIGVRLGRRLTERVSVEVDIDYGLSTFAFRPEVESGLQVARASFESTWDRLLTSTFGRTHTVTATVTTDPGHRRQIVSSGTALIHLRTHGRTRPYISAGGGAVSLVGPSPSATLVGDSQISLGSFGGPLPAPVLAIHQIDRVTIRSEIENSMTWIVGAGVKHDLGGRWGVRGDVRDSIARTRVATTIEANPEAVRVPNSVTGALILLLNPPLLFATPPGDSTLGGPAISGFETFRSSGVTHHVNVTAGVFWRF